MKRNILKAGRSSLAISIPKIFVQSNNLSQGQEITVECHGPTMIATCGTPSKSIKKIDLQHLKPDTESRILDKILGVLFKQGADTYEIMLPNQSLKAKMRGILRDGKLNMYEEPSGSHDTSIIIHSPIKNYDETTLEQMAAVIIKNLFVTLEEFVDLLSRNELTDSAVEEMVSRDRVINDNSDICRRMINQNIADYKSTSWYVFVDKCEKMGDLLKNMILFAKSRPELTRKNINQFDNITNCLYMLFSGTSNFNTKKMDSFFSACDAASKDVESCKDLHLYYYLKSLLTLIRDAYSDILIRNM